MIMGKELSVENVTAMNDDTLLSVAAANRHADTVKLLIDRFENAEGEYGSPDRRSPDELVSVVGRLGTTAAEGRLSEPIKPIMIGWEH
jgi:hypothetical protein